jgi:hypothetical protein
MWILCKLGEYYAFPPDVNLEHEASCLICPLHAGGTEGTPDRPQRGPTPVRGRL